MTRLKFLRKKLGVSEAYCANYLGISLISYTELENGKTKLSPQQENLLKNLYHAEVSSNYQPLSDSEKIKKLKNFLLTKRR